MAQFDNWPPFQNFSFEEFSFPVDRYEEWEGGRMISSGEAHFQVRFKYNKGGFFSRRVGIDVNIIGNPMPAKLISNMRFDGAITSGDRILFYIAAEQSNVQNTTIMMLSSLVGSTRESKIFERNEPIVSSVFTINQKVAKVSFSFGNPDRLIELY